MEARNSLNMFAFSRHLVEAQQFNPKFIEALFEKAEAMGGFLIDKKIGKISKRLEEEQIAEWRTAGKTMVLLFYEPSTRTRASFETAMRCLGGQVLFSTENTAAFSSLIRGEILEDTIRIFDLYLADIMVLRHYEEGTARRAAMVLVYTPMINAGDGPGQHPTQALIDLFTLWKATRRLTGLKVAMVGDLAFGRTVRSLSYLLGKYQDNAIYYVSPEALRMRDDIKNYLGRHNVPFSELDDIKLLPAEIDAIYLTRIQKGESEEGKENFEDKDMRNRFSRDARFGLNAQILERFSKKTIVMHPLPRGPELSGDIDKDPYGRNWYFRQTQFGLFVRMALLQIMLADDFIFDPFRCNEAED